MRSKSLFNIKLDRFAVFGLYVSVVCSAVIKQTDYILEDIQVKYGGLSPEVANYEHV